MLAEELESIAEKVDYLEVEYDRMLLDVAATRAKNNELQRELDTLRPAPMPLVTGLTTTAYDGIHPWQPNVTWKALQPEPFGDLNPAPIENARAKGLPIRLRLMCGIHSPAWLHTLAGSLDVWDVADKKFGTVPKWWTGVARAAYRDLIRKLAEAYDGILPAVSMSGGMTFYAEPCMRGFEKPEACAAAVAAGLTYEADRDALEDAIDAHRAFRQTRTFMAFNVYQHLFTDGTFRPDISTTLSLMESLKELPGSIVQNNSIRTPSISGYKAMYDAMTRPKSFQTAGATRIGSVYETLMWAVNQGAHLVESYKGFDAAIFPDQHTEINAALDANK